MWDYILNIHSSELLSIKAKESRINKSYIYIYIYIYMDNLYFIPNNISLQKILKS